MPKIKKILEENQERPEIVDLHMHTTASDGTDTPAEIVESVRKAGIQMFSVTDHDGIAGVCEIRQILSQKKAVQRPLAFINGIEFSCKDDEGKYHILGYGYDETSQDMLTTVERAHENRLKKVAERLKFLKEDFGLSFRQEDIDALFKNHNPGKPHIANMMIRYGYAKDIDDAMKNFLNKKKVANVYLPPEKAIETILKSGGIPVLAHPSYGDGDQFIVGEEMNQRLKRLTGFGLKGVEAYYSGFSNRLIQEVLGFAEQYDLYVTAGSDYHGSNKLIALGETNLEMIAKSNDRMKEFLLELHRRQKILLENS